ncbi:MAG: hypothetical protein methR_P0965 [Methyloprofundus sp.]|nr:MAG: hypothetical protein methR_P0965 [Methyloprofundus sp.]
MRLKTIVLSSLALILLTGCSSFGYGVTEAFLDSQEQQDTRSCQITGRAFKGLDPLLADGLKVLMVHGIGTHTAGYSAELLEKLTTQLKLHKKSPGYKTITLIDQLDPSKELGSLRVHHYFNKDQSKSLLFYELLWTSITAEEKKIIAYDSTGEYSHRRADINNILKTFSNDTMPDSFLYLGDSRQDILMSFTQAYCWMAAANWQELAEHTQTACSFNSKHFIPNLRNNHFAFISHSLGSRITIDGLQRIASLTGNESTYFRGQLIKPQTAVKLLKDKHSYIFMLANQLPILQLGRKKAEITQQHDAYCNIEGKFYQDRMYRATSIIAFNDPNDIASYPIPYGFTDTYLDSRLCLSTTNVDINIANIIDLLGFGTAANPLTAHSGYKSDDRVIALIAHGIGTESSADIVNERCKWIEELD